MHTTINTSQFIVAHGTELFCAEKPFFVRGVAFMDDTTLWDSTKTTPSLDFIAEEDYRFAAQGTINTIRLAVKMDYFIDDNNNPCAAGFTFLDQQLAYAKQYGFKLLIDMHIPAGGAIQDFGLTDQNKYFWQSTELQNRFIQGWQLIATRYKNEPAIFGYELFNEAASKPEEYWSLIARTLPVVRSADPQHLIAIQADREWGYRNLQDSNILCIYHFYEPLYFTHQNVRWNHLYKSKTPVPYPGVAMDCQRKESQWDGKKIAAHIQEIKKIAETYKRPVIIGEFAVATAIREAAQKRWLSDLLYAIRHERLSGYIYWRQTEVSTEDLHAEEYCSMAVRNKGTYLGQVQFDIIYKSL